MSDEPIWVREYPDSEQLHVDLTFFDKNGFNVNDKIRILRAFADIYPGQCAIAVLFAPVADMWEFIERQLVKTFRLVGSVDLDFNGNYVGFDNIMHEMYDDAAFCDLRIDRKLTVLKMSPLTMRVLLLSDEGIKDKTLFFERLKAIKFSLRDSMFFDVKEVPVVCHMPDNRNEAEHLKHLLLSTNNLETMRKKFTQRYTSKFIEMLNSFKSWCITNNIPITDTVIVGSAAMTVFGLKEADDIDFTLMAEHRERLNGDGMYKISDSLEIVRKDYVRSVDGEIIPDETVITDDNMYFWFYGCKFLNLDLLYKKKKYNHRPKDIEDLRLLDLFFELEYVFDDKTSLRKQVEDEMQRRKLYI